MREFIVTILAAWVLMVGGVWYVVDKFQAPKIEMQWRDGE